MRLVKRSWQQSFLFKILLGLSIIFAINCWATRGVVFETPTALTLERGEYALETSLYDGGGFLLKGSVGINKYINLGIEEYVHDFIGSGSMQWEIPHVMAKFRLTPFGDEMVNIALGYDTLYNGSFQPFDRVSYGPYVAVTVGFPQQSSFLQSPHFFSFGLRVPVFYNLAEPDFFMSLHMRLFPFFELATEFSNIHFAKQYKYYFINNNLIIFKIGDVFTIDIVIQVAGKIDETAKNNIRAEWARGIRLSFQSFF